jgi:aminoglycoside phosphotransferase (APT) family kinase protein
MVALTTETYDAEKVRKGLEAWLAQNGNFARDVNVAPLGIFGAGGASSATYKVDALWSEAGTKKSAELVARLPPAGSGIFETYDLKSQADIMGALAGAGLATPKPVWFEADLRWIGTNFLVMPFLKGRVPESTPPYTKGGWLFNAQPEDRAKVMNGFTDALADLHKLDWQALGMSRFIGTKAPGLSAELSWWKRYFDWASEGLETEGAAMVARALDWCVTHKPSVEPPYSFLWGDARLGNIMYDERLNVLSMLDWEMAAIGPAEVDLGWESAHRRQSIELAGGDGFKDDLAGFPSRADQIARYEQRLGRKLEDLRWYEAFGATRLGVCHVAVQNLVRKSGVATMNWGLPLKRWAVQTMAEY